AASFVEKIVGEKTESILNQTDATLMMCRLERPFISNNLIQVSVPPLAEWEVGFAYWMEKITKLAQELSLPINFVCNKGSRKAIELMMETLKSSVPIDFELYDDWDNIAGLKALDKVDSIQIFVSAGNGDVSYRDAMDGLAKRLGKFITNQNLILIFPSRLEDQHIDEYEDIQAAPIFRKISREIGNMFGK